MTKKQSLDLLRAIFLVASSPENDEQNIINLISKKECFEIITKGKHTSWKHIIKTTEI